MSILRDRGPMIDDELARALHESGYGPLDDMLDAVEYLEHPAHGYLQDIRHVALDALLEGRVLTHRVTMEDVEAGTLNAETDLTPLLDMEPSDRVRPLSDLRLGVDVELTEGTLIGVTVRGGVLHLAPVDVLAEAQLQEILDAIVPDGDVIEFDQLVWQMMHDHPDLFTAPTAPLGDLLDTAGYDRSVDMVARRGFDFAAHRADMFTAFVARTYGLPYDAACAVGAFFELTTSVGGGPDAVTARIVADPDVYAGFEEPLAAASAERIAVAGAGVGRDLDEALTAAIALSRRGPRRVRAGACWLAGRLSDRQGSPVAAEQYFHDALLAEPGWELALYDLAACAADRGDAVGGLALLDRLEGGDTHPLYAVLEEFRPQDRPDLGRNDRCWCGSGRKYKSCHLGKAGIGLDERAWGLYQKAVRFAEYNEFAVDLSRLAEIRADYLDGDTDKALDGGLVEDVVLFEGGGFVDYLRRRGALLPDDERALAEQWLQIERSVFDVEQVRPGEGLTLRDLRTGDRHEVRERTASTQLHEGELLCTRVVPAGEVMRIFGGIEPVSLPQRAPLIDMLDAGADPEELVDFLSRRLAPPRLVTRGGEPMMLCIARFSVSDATAVRRKLSRRYGKAVDGQWVLTEEGVGSSVTGSFRVHDGELAVEAMVESRFDDMLAVAREIAPDAVLLDQSRTPAAEVLDQLRQVAAGSPSAPDGNHEIAALLDDHVREYERKWIDDTIPALDGLTPRQAAADPTRRGDLIRLLNSFPQEERPGTMSVARLREMLGL